MRMLLQIQLTLVLILFAGIVGNVLIVSPEQQRSALDGLSRQLASQIAMLKTLDKPSVALFLKHSRHLSASPSGTKIVAIQLHGKSWVFSSDDPMLSSDPTQDSWLESRQSIYHHSVNKQNKLNPVIGELRISTPVSYRLGHPFEITISLLITFISISLIFQLRVQQRLRENKSNSNKFDLSDNRPLSDKASSYEETCDTIPNENYPLESDADKAELELAKKSAVEASRIKSQIIANTSHELLTPLNSIVGFSDSLLKNSFPRKQRHDFLSRINDNAEHLLGLVNDLLDFSTNKQKQYEIKYQETDIYQLLSSIAKTLAGEAQAKGLEFLTDFDELYTKKIITDKVRLRQVISNLLVNAIRNTASGHITIGASIQLKNANSLNEQFTGTYDTSHRHFLHISIEDTGAGIAEKDQQKIFSSMVSFSTNDYERAKPQNNLGLGLGLGLSIVTSIVQRMNASLSINSALGDGTRFNLYFPIKDFTDKPTHRSSVKETRERVLLLDGYKPSAANISNRLTRKDYIVTLENGFERFISAQDKNDFGIVKLNAGINLNEAEIHWNALLQKTTIHIMLLAPSGTSVISSKLLANKSNIQFFELPLLRDDFPDLAIFDFENIAHPSFATEQDIEAPSANDRLKVLVADDNPSNLTLLEFLLRQLHCEVEMVSSGKEVKELANQKHFDAMFIDVRMQPIDGLEVITYIRKQVKDSDSLIFACTAHTSAEEYRILLESGFDSVVHKPLTIEKIQALLESHNKVVSQHAVDLKSSRTFSDTSVYSNENDTDKFVSTFSLSVALQKTAGNKELAKQRLVDLNTALLKTERNKSNLKKQDSDSILNHFHDLHGLAAMTGALILHRQLGYLETQFKEIQFSSSTPHIILEASFGNIAVFTAWYKGIDVEVLFE